MCWKTVVILQALFVSFRSFIGLPYLSNIILYPSQPGLVQRQYGNVKFDFIERVMGKNIPHITYPENITAATTSCHSCAVGTLKRQCSLSELQCFEDAEGPESNHIFPKHAAFMVCLMGSDQKQPVICVFVNSIGSCQCLKRLPVS